jgi:c-di-GMP-related signal transduction protein
MSSFGIGDVPACNLAPVQSGSARYLARQPILNLKGSLFGYELLFRDGTDTKFDGDGEIASNTMIDNVIVYGFRKLTAGMPAFINCTAETLTGDYISILPSSMTVIEILESVEPNPEIISSCRRLKAEGYRIALDDFVYRPEFEPLIRIADFIKIDYLATTASERRALISKLESFSGALLAEKVEMEQDFEQARKEGFTLFQGYYFCKPDPLKKLKVPSNHYAHLRLLQIMQKQPLDFETICEQVKSEPSIAYRLIRYVNSPVCGIRQEVTSIKTALLAIGEDFFRRIATLAIACDLNVGPSTEIVRMALVRARFCETAANSCDLDSSDQYLLGLFSLLDAMLQKPMTEAIAPLGLRKSMEEALLGIDNALRYPLYWLESHEHGDFAQCDELAKSHGFAPQMLGQNFADATEWADKLLSAS